MSVHTLIYVCKLWPLFVVHIHIHIHTHIHMQWWNLLRCDLWPLSCQGLDRGLHAYIHACTYASMHAYTYACMHIHVCMHASSRFSSVKYIYTHIRTYIHAYIVAGTCFDVTFGSSRDAPSSIIHIHVHTYTNIHAYIHSGWNLLRCDLWLLSRLYVCM